MTLSSEEIVKLISNPDLAAEKANLVYISEEDLCIERKKRGRGFQYLKEGEPLDSEEDIKRIKSLVIPPAWEKVKICPHNTGHLQVVGLDTKGRKQYMYHPDWTRIRNQTKFYKMAAFGKVLPKVRAQVEKDLKLKGMPRQKVLALVIRLMEETHIRIGNEAYARENKSYGLSTLRSRHVDISSGKMKFNFLGKRGIEHSVSIEDKKLVKLVNQCEEIPGWEVFKYYNESGKKQRIDSGMVNEYIQEISGELFSAKDFRTWSATKIFFEHLRETGYVEEEKENKKIILQAYDVTAEALGNTRSVCRSYYVHPHVVRLYESGRIVPYFKKVERKRTSKPQFSQTEEVLLELLKDFDLDLHPSDPKDH
ncbi:DNA topoisomerase-1 [Salinimicrobium catena]|uniref:DNA topoisomerase n=1 Tax=Salinimicrobium catena TaxID=390640 RepID=A0A1H5PEP1_9FLAO|nr:DNA topoisomerase IB [Salinimicrobium catena]SDL82341.1 DNA topoisomerase-1 [Salinimicrobium catena]SEF12392.1 DNA topoisomerase-1 [Salinimicrobium catena]